MVDAPERIRVAQDADGFWTCREAVSSSQEYVRADLYAALEAQLAEAKAERDEYYARGFGLRSHVVRYLNEGASKETLRGAFMRWESASGARFSISPAALEATAAPMVTEEKCDGQACYYYGCQHLPGCALKEKQG